MVVCSASPFKLKAFANGKCIEVYGMFNDSSSGWYQLYDGPSSGSACSFNEGFNEMHGMFNDSISGWHQLYDGPSTVSACSFNERFNEKYLIFVGYSIGQYPIVKRHAATQKYDDPLDSLNFP